MRHPNTSEHWNTSGMMVTARYAAACRSDRLAEPPDGGLERIIGSGQSGTGSA